MVAQQRALTCSLGWLGAPPTLLPCPPARLARAHGPASCIVKKIYDIKGSDGGYDRDDHDDVMTTVAMVDLIDLIELIDLID